MLAKDSDKKQNGELKLFRLYVKASLILIMRIIY